MNERTGSTRVKAPTGAGRASSGHAERRNGMALAGSWCSLAGLFTLLVFPLSFMGLGFGLPGLKNARADVTPPDRGLAVAGVLMGGLGVALSGIVLAFLLTVLRPPTGGPGSTGELPAYWSRAGIGSDLP